MNPNLTYVVDTNIIIENPSFYEILSKSHNENISICIPFAVVKELDQLKTSSGKKGKNARDFIHLLDKMANDELFRSGVQVSEKITISLSNFDPCGESADQKIIQTAKGIPGTPTLLTNDVNLRIQSRRYGLKAMGLDCCGPSEMPKIITLEWVPEEIIAGLYAGSPILADQVLRGCRPNQNFILKNGSISALAVEKNGWIELVPGGKYYGVTPQNTEQIFALNALCDNDVPLVTLSGKAGSGKTLISLAAAMASKKYYRKILVARPMVPLSNKDIGFLPGDINEKIDPYMRPLYDNFSILDGLNHTKKPSREYMEAGKIEICPLTYIRGRSLPKVFFIIDEAQNLTKSEVKTIITRAGEGTKIVLTGDISQIDHPKLNRNNNGLLYLIEKMAGQNLFSHITLKKSERSRLAELAASIL